VTPLPPPAVPWQITGNHWIALPCIHPADASIHAVSVLHRGSRAAIEIAGSLEFASGARPALIRPALVIDGVRHELSAAPIAWERAFGWLPTFTCTIGTVVVRGTIFAPYGRDADIAGAVYAVAVENRGPRDIDVTLVFEGELGTRQLRVRTPRPLSGEGRVASAPDGVVVLDGTEVPGLVALAFAASAGEPPRVEGNRFSFHMPVKLAKGSREHLALYMAAGPERDGALATASVLRRRGWHDLLSATRDAIRALEQATGVEAIDRLINRNLLFAYFYGVARALDDAHFYLVRTRVPWHSAGVTVKDWESLMWTIPAVQLADGPLARELILRVCELHGYAAGRGVQYFDGTLFEPGFNLEGAAAYALAAERYIRDTADDRIVDDPVLADTLYMVADLLGSRRDSKVPLYTTEMSLSGSAAPHPFTLHGNAVVAQAFDVLRRTLDEETAAELQDPEAVRAAIKRHFVVDREGKSTYASAIDLAGHSTTDDDPAASTLWLPFYEAVQREDSTYRRSVKGIGAEPNRLAQQCARLLGPESSKVLDWLRRAPLDSGLAAEFIDPEGRPTGNAGDASLSGLLAWSCWYAVHALGERP
jgi:hypothetical protein